MEAVSMDVPDQNVRLKDLVMVGDFATAAGVSPAAITSYRKKDPRFPEPWGYIGVHPVWKRESVSTWMQGRLGPGRRTDLRKKHLRALVEELQRLEAAE